MALVWKHPTWALSMSDVEEGYAGDVVVAQVMNAFGGEPGYDWDLKAIHHATIGSPGNRHYGTRKDKASAKRAAQDMWDRWVDACGLKSKES